MKETQVTKVAYRNPGSEDVMITSESAFNDKTKKATEAKEPLPEVVAGPQTFLYKFPDTVDEAVALAGGTSTGEYSNTEVFLGHVIYAFSLRQHNTANDILRDSSFEAKEGAWDVSASLAEKQERAKMTPEERAIKDLAKGGINITPDQLRAALQLIQAQASGASA